MRPSSKYLALAGLALLIALAPLVFPSSYYYRVGALTFVNGLAVIGIVVLTGYAGQISLGHAGFVGVGAYACALAPPHLGLHPALAVLLGAGVSAALAWVVGRPILRLKGYALGVATLGFGVLISMILANEAWLTGGPDGLQVADLGLRDWLRALGWKLKSSEFWYGFCAIALLIGAWMALNLRDSPTGRALRALHGSEVAARAVGVDVARAKLHAFVISAVYASVAGSLLALQNQFVTPDVAGFLHSIEMVTMAVLGGVASAPGAILGAAALTILPQALTVFAEYEQIALGLIMMAMMIFMRRGVAPTLLARFGRGGS